MNVLRRKPNPATIDAVRPLTRDDLQFLRQKSARPAIVNLRESHHHIARYIAAGKSNTEISEAVGITVSRVSLIRNSPAMADLVAKYRGMETESWLKGRDAYHESINAAGLKAWRQINDQLDDADVDGAEPIPLKTLLAVADSSADRTGHHKRTTKENINVDFAAKLEAAFSRSRQVLEPQIIEGEVLPDA